MSKLIKVNFESRKVESVENKRIEDKVILECDFAKEQRQSYIDFILDGTFSLQDIRDVQSKSLYPLSDEELNSALKLSNTPYKRAYEKEENVISVNEWNKFDRLWVEENFRKMTFDQFILAAYNVGMNDFDISIKLDNLGQ